MNVQKRVAIARPVCRVGSVESHGSDIFFGCHRWNRPGLICGTRGEVVCDQPDQMRKFKKRSEPGDLFCSYCRADQ